MYLFLVLVAALISVARSQGPAAPPSPTASWKTLSGDQPVVISNGQSGVYPDQTLVAYADALGKTAGGLFLYCDLQLTKDGLGICRTILDLTKSTGIENVFPNGKKTYEVNGKATTGYFSIDFTQDQLLNNVTARQIQQSRPPDFDDTNFIVSPEIVRGLIISYTNTTGLPAFPWLNVEYSKFYEQHKLNMTGYLLSAIRNVAPAYISSTEVGLLRTLRPRLGKTKTRTVFKVPNVDAVEPTTNQTYGSILSNLTSIKTFASGILVPKDLIWPIDDKGHLEAPTRLVQDAHRQKLEIFTFTFAADVTLLSYNYSYDPIKEVLNFVDAPNFAVDGVLTDFPTTASIAIECYANDGGASSVEVTDKAVLPPFTGKQVITHSGGDSGSYPGSTRISYMSAISKGADFIDCPVQITKDGIPICRQSPDLLVTTNVAQTALGSRTKTVTSIQEAPGIFTFDFTWDEISTVKAQIFSPYGQTQQLFRDPSNDGTQGILKLSDFLSIAKDTPKVGVYLVLENAYLLNGTIGLDTAGAVVSALKDAGFDNKSDVVIQSEDSSVLRSLRKVSSAKLIYQVPLANVSLTDAVLEEIKQFADGIAVPRALVSPFENFITEETTVVSRVHNQSLSLLVSFFRNEFTSLPFNFLTDPTLELSTFVQYYKIDGIVTDFPGTAKSYLTNRCLRDPEGYQIPVLRLADVNLAAPPAGAPFPPLSIAEPPLPVSAPAPSPANEKSSGLNTLPGVWLLVTCLLLQFFREVQRHFSKLL